MIFLNKIIVNGFKSLATKTAINFDKEMSGIVGPNGSGKSNIVDAISAMPYTDHFGSDSSYWTNPYQTMYNWGKTAAERQKETPTPAIARTWITAYDTPYWKPTVIYNGEMLERQIQGLYDAGLTGGYMTWNSGSNLAKYKQQSSAFNKSYKSKSE